MNILRIIGVCSLVTLIGGGALTVVLPMSVMAQASLPTEYELLEPLPCIPSETNDCTEGELQTKIDFETYVQYAFNLFIALAAVAAVLVIVYGGFLYITSDSWQKKNEGFEKVKNAVLGLLLVLSSYLILQTVNPQLVKIPTTLVPKLTVVREQSLLGSFFRNVARDADKYKTAMTTYTDEKARLEGELTSLDAQRKSFQEQLEELQAQGLSDSDPQVGRLKTLIASLDDQMARGRADIRLLVSKAAFDTEVHQWASPTNGTPNKTYFKDAITELNITYAQQRQQLINAGAQADQLAELESYRVYNEAVIKINEQVAKVNDVQREYFNEQTVPSRVIGGIGDAVNETVSIPLSNISPADWLTYSPAEYKKDLAEAQSEFQEKSAVLIVDYRAKITDPELRRQLDEHYQSKAQEIKKIPLQ